MHIPAYFLEPLGAERAGLGLCGPGDKKELLSVIAELMASCNNDLLFPCTVSCNIPAISPCSLRSPCLPHTYAQLSLGSQRTRVVLHHPPFSLVRGNMYLSWNPHLRGRRPYQTVTADPTCFPAPYFHRCHGNVKFFRVLGAMQRQTDRHSVSFLLSLSTD